MARERIRGRRNAFRPAHRLTADVGDDMGEAVSSVNKAAWKPRVIQATRDPRSVHVAILLSLYNGEAFLNRQLDSFIEQTHGDWTLYWRDDGSTDSSRAIMLSFQANRGAGRCVEIDVGSGERVGVTDSYARLLEAAPAGGVIAFADQDDVWLPEKVARGVDGLSRASDDAPRLYCARQILTDRALKEIALSPVIPQPFSVLTALAQNIATGCTVMMNDRARQLLTEMQPAPPFIMHDWWAYLVVTAAGGTVEIDQSPVVLYRQHGQNAVGAPSSWRRRGYAAIRRGPGAFMDIFRSNLSYLLEHRKFLDPHVVAILAAVQNGLGSGKLTRLRLLRRFPHLTRASLSERVLFRLWFVIG